MFMLSTKITHAPRTLNLERMESEREREREREREERRRERV